MSGIDIALVRGPRDASGYGRMPLPPLGLLSVAASLEADSWRVAVVDAPGEGLDTSAFLQRLRTLRPEVIGLSKDEPGFCEGGAAERCEEFLCEAPEKQ